MEEKIKAQKQTLWSILDKAKAGLVAILELQTMVGVIFRWVLEQRSQQTYAMGIRGLDPTLHKPLILEDALGKVIEFPLSLADSWNVSLLLQDDCLLTY